MSAVFKHPLTRRRAPIEENRHGNKVRAWAQAAEVVIPGWAVDAGDTRENNAGRDGTVVVYTARHLGFVDLLSSDRVLLWGEEFEVDGVPLRQPGVTARTMHTIVALRRAEG